jgi:hypothetical protein
MYCQCGKPAIMKIEMGKDWFDTTLYYCEDHIPVGFNGIVPDDCRQEVIMRS